ncbi:MAG: HNH endonuclease [Microbacteriaceae bacterium]
MKQIRQPLYDPEKRLYLLPLTRGQFSIHDVEDLEWVSQWNWRGHPTNANAQIYYAERTVCRNGVRHTVQMHRALAERWGWDIEGKAVDHISRDTLDQRRTNLRVATAAQNSRNSKRNTKNTSGLKGVSWEKSKSKWRAQISINDADLYLGLFETKEQAAAAYEAASLKHHGEFGRTESGSNLLKLA